MHPRDFPLQHLTSDKAGNGDMEVEMRIDDTWADIMRVCASAGLNDSNWITDNLNITDNSAWKEREDKLERIKKGRDGESRARGRILNELRSLMDRGVSSDEYRVLERASGMGVGFGLGGRGLEWEGEEARREFERLPRVPARARLDMDQAMQTEHSLPNSRVNIGTNSDNDERIGHQRNQIRKRSSSRHRAEKKQPIPCPWVIESKRPHQNPDPNPPSLYPQSPTFKTNLSPHIRAIHPPSPIVSSP